jgi:hypothetical protein
MRAGQIAACTDFAAVKELAPATFELHNWALLALQRVRLPGGPVTAVHMCRFDRQIGRAHVPLHRDTDIAGAFVTLTIVAPPDFVFRLGGSVDDPDSDAPVHQPEIALSFQPGELWAWNQNEFHSGGEESLTSSRIKILYQVTSGRAGLNDFYTQFGGPMLLKQAYEGRVARLSAMNGDRSRDQLPRLAEAR